MGVYQIAWVLDRETQTTGGERLVLIALADRANEQNECWPSKADIARRANISETNVRKNINRLVERGLLERVVQSAPDSRQRADRQTNLYRLIGPPIAGGRQRPPVSSRGVASDRAGGRSAASGGSLATSKPSLEPSENRGAVPSNHVSVSSEDVLGSMNERGIVVDFGERSQPSPKIDERQMQRIRSASEQMGESDGREADTEAD